MSSQTERALQELTEVVVALKTEVTITNKQLAAVITKHERELFGDAGQNGLKGKVIKLMDFMHVARKQRFIIYAAAITALLSATTTLAVTVLTKPSQPIQTENHHAIETRPK